MVSNIIKNIMSFIFINKKIQNITSYLPLNYAKKYKIIKNI